MKLYWYLLCAILLLTVTGCGQITKSSGNTAPIIISVAKPNLYVIDGQGVSLNFAATDANGDSLTYLWECSAGMLSATNTTSVSWTAPNFTGNSDIISITAKVSDGTDESGYSWLFYINYPTSNVTQNNNNNNNQNNNSGAYQQPVTVDPTITPAIPAGIYVNTQIAEIILTWNAVTTYMDGSAIGNNLSGYRIYRSIAEAGPFNTRYQEVSANTTTYTDRGIGVQYWYKITAISKDGKESLQSGTVSSLDNIAPAIPASLGVRGYSPVNSTMMLSWAENGETDIAGYKVYRADGDSNYEGVYHYIGKTGHTSYLDATTAPNSDYWYRISSYDFSGNESVMCQRYYTNNQSPVNVTGLSAGTGIDTGSIILSWNGNSERDLAGYRLYCLIGGTYQLLRDETVIKAGPYIITGLNSGQVYSFYVIAVDNYLNYSPGASNLASAAAR
ncbi:MAG: hypothetical protein DKM50_02150 [Candidatus Margulisiibacteriota bacterium]|nr:MAG: hypothetical protein A2X43_06610 [Candidatus Margulisbacteria bacterium GWD2_39_127]OGI05309.1 MAG: hypothetical protein A2X42_03875 [Candidatus Margulisbacteria bacterium GWF2_38_17]OGI10832.1 MAG: hypothetical protein A2X41_05600 [Candidatus Margulisbacteria bacterium GWE2_39_32]PZM83518.1 MAG: hypothetical protein DKM50_02150 [Candidatus Margulisiibacteriota bacterium]HAR64305.1 hypothetical protein [Candidatus Margulisiibacteriota bacterium]